MPSRTVDEGNHERPQPRLDKDKVLVFLPIDEDHQWTAKIEDRYPGIEVRWARSYNDESMIAEECRDPTVWDGITLLCMAWYPPPAELMSNVKFVQVTSAGMDHWNGHPAYQNKDVIFCNGNGLSPPQIAEWVMGCWLAHQHHLFHYRENMAAQTWEPQATVPDVRDSVGLRIGILGYGAIGRQVGRLAHALGMEIYAYTRRPRLTAESRRDRGFCVPWTGDPAGELPARWFDGETRADVDAFLAQELDVVVISLPLTDETRWLVSDHQFDILAGVERAQGEGGARKDGGNGSGSGRSSCRRGRKPFLVNIARGAIVHTEALVRALESGSLSGAALDVTDPEPLPKDHALWRAPNVFVTPHVSWISSTFWDRTLQLFEANLERLHAGKPVLNEVKRTCF